MQLIIGFSLTFKEIIHPPQKMKFLSLFTHPHCFKNFFFLNTKEDILKNVGNQTVDGPPSSFVFSRRNNLIKVWKNLRVSK